jgi:protein arginine kinase activator
MVGSGKFGCEKCYGVFQNKLEPFLKSYHKGTSHVGRIPGGFEEDMLIVKEIKRLKERMNEAVNSEDFEDAAVFRDKIKELQGNMKNRGK